MGFSLGEIAVEELAADAAISVTEESLAADFLAQGTPVTTTSSASGGLLETLKSYAITAGFNYAITSIFSPNTRLAHPDAQTFLGNGYSSVDPIVVPYGRRRIGCSRARLAVRSSRNQTNDVLILLFFWGEGEIEALDAMYFDGVLRIDGNGNPLGSMIGFVNWANHLGADDQVADARLISSVADASLWNDSCTVSGIAYSRAELGWTPDRFPTGQPVVTADYRGRKIYDPRSGLTAYTRNPACVIRDYLTNTRYGCRVPSAMIDDASFQSAANTCDEAVNVPLFGLTSTGLITAGAGYQAADVITLDGGLPSKNLRAQVLVNTVDGSGAITGWSLVNGGSYASNAQMAFGQYATTQHFAGTDPDTGNTLYTSGSGATFGGATTGYVPYTQARYTCDGVVNIDQQPIDNVRALLTSCRGFLVFSAGKWKLKIDKAETPVSFVLNEDNITGGWSVQYGGKRAKFNRVKTSFFNEDAGFVPDFAVWESTVYRAQDNGTILEQMLALPFTTSVYTAQQICQIELNRSRFTRMISLRATIAASCLEIGDVVPVKHSTPGWPAAGDPVEGKLFRVVEMEFLRGGEIRLSLLEYSASVYSLATLTVIAPAQTSLPDATVVATPGTPVITETLYQTTGSAGVKSKATVTWVAASDVWVVRGGFYELEYKLSASSAWKRISPLSDTSVELFDLAAGRYDFRIRAVNALGVHSGYSGTTTQEIYGLTAAPSNVANFAVQSYASHAKFTWSKPSANSDLDVLIGGRTYVRFSPLMAGATWDHGSLVNQDGYPGDTSIGFGPLLTGTYLAKHQDSSGNYSVTEASFVVTEALLTGLTTVATVTESPTFAGAKSNVVATDGGIQLDGTTLIDSMLTLTDSWGAIDSLGGVQGSGTYTFNSVLDQGVVQTCRVYATLGSLAFDVDDLVDSRTNNIDDWGLVDGAVVEDAEAQLMVRTTNDDPAGAPTWSAYHSLGMVGDYNARAFSFRLDFATGNATHNRSVTSLSVTAKR